MNTDKMEFSEFKKYWLDKMAKGPVFVRTFRKQETGEKVIGMICAELGKFRCAGTATISSFAIHPDYHGHNYGESTLDGMIEHLQGQGVTRVQLFVEEDNVPARGFYEHMGFEQEGVLRKAFDREGQIVNEILMAKLFD